MDTDSFSITKYASAFFTDDVMSAITFPLDFKTRSSLSEVSVVSRSQFTRNKSLSITLYKKCVGRQPFASQSVLVAD